VPSLFVDGTWTSGTGGKAEVINPFDGSVVETVDQAGPEDVERAVAAARTAFDTGRGAPRPPPSGAPCSTGSPTCWSATRS
jgi:betaine-aldehyde dehydrogenase